jgi:hypothetical protein
LKSVDLPMLQAGELDLQLAFVGLRALREDLEDQLGAVHDAALDLDLDVARLRRRELVVEDDERGVQRRRGRADLLDLAAAGIQARIGPVPLALHHLMAHHARALHEAHHLLDAFLIAVVAEVEAHDDCRLRVGGPLGTVQRGSYSASLSAPRLIGRDGTTVEMACL